jgi:hypothetical protein
MSMSAAYKTTRGPLWLAPSDSKHQTGSMDERYRHSLSRRLRAVHSLYYDATATMTLEQVNAVVVEGALPIAFSLVHQVLIEDFSRAVLGGTQQFFAEPWTSRLALAIADDGKTRTVKEMMAQRIGDYEAFCEFQRAVFEATEAFVDEVDPASLDDVVVGHPYPATLALTFQCARGRHRRNHPI